MSAHKDTNYSVGGNTTQYCVVVSNASGNIGNTIPKDKLVILDANDLNVEQYFKLLFDKLKGLSQDGLHSVFPLGGGGVSYYRVSYYTMLVL